MNSGHVPTPLSKCGRISAFDSVHGVLIHTISQRAGAYLEREGLLVWDIENSYLQLEAPEDSTLD